MISLQENFLWCEHGDKKEKKSFKKGESLLERLLVKKRMRAVKPKTKPAKGRSKKR